MKHEYLTLNGKVVYEKIGEGSSAKIMIFSYDEMGRPFAVKYSKNNGTKFTNYFYALNQQGDVVKIFRPVAVTDANGNTTGYTEKTYATYTYDAWGKLIGITNSAGTSIINKQTTSTSLANLNPLRYRGYYYDNETGFYYLQSRYYDPAVKRFINADIYASTGQGFIGTNMFAYCNNNPISFSDYTGYSLVDADTDSEDDYTVEIEMVMGVGIVVTLTYSDHTATILCAAEHHKRGTTNKANLSRHQNGQRRKKQDAGGEKGDARRPVDRSNKKHFESQSPSPDFWKRAQYTIFGIGCFAGMVVLAVDDLVPGGEADDQYIAQIEEVMEMYFSLAFS